MSMWTSLEPASTTVDPGGTARVRLRLRNTGDVVDEYRLEPVGALSPWMTVEPQTLRLYPGTTGTVELTFAPPRTPDAQAGPNPYAVRIVPTEHPEAVTVPEGNLTVTPFTELRAELVPHTVKGVFRGKPRLAVDNVGNTKVTASLSASDNGDELSYELRPQNIQIEPGRAAFVDARLKPRQIIWFGSKQQRPYALHVQRSGAEPLPVDGMYVQRGFLPRWLAATLGIALSLAIAFVMIWFAYQPRVATLATEQLDEVGVGTVPSPSASEPTVPDGVSSSVPAAPDVAAPQTSKAEQDSADSDGSGSGSGSGTGGGGKKAAPTPSETQTVAAGSQIIGQGSDRCVEVTGAKKLTEGKDGTHLQLWECVGTANQKWDFRGDGTVRSLGLCMDVAWGSTEDGAVIQLARCSGNPAQQFVLSTAGDLVNPQADKCVDAKDNGTGDGTDLLLWTCNGQPNQKWRVED
jgi:hypothetical protein